MRLAFVFFLSIKVWVFGDWAYRAHEERKGDCLLCARHGVCRWAD